VFQIPHLKKKKNRVSSGFARVARVWPGCCHSRSFVKPGPVQPPGRPGPGSTRRAGLGLITVACTPVTLAVPYLSIGLAGCSVGPRISRSARKLARTPRVIKKKKREVKAHGTRRHVITINNIKKLGVTYIIIQ
jgi:hypothetical protein